MLLLLTLTVLAAPCDGGCDVHHAELTLTTPDRPVPVRLSWPDAPGPFPVVVFSHGMGGSGSGYRPLVDHWVAHGFVVAQPTHADAVALLSAAERRRYGSVKDFVNDPKAASSWRQRPDEIARILDALPELAAEAGIADRIDGERIGVGGHSFGAHTAMLVGGLRLGPGGLVDLSDPRPDALMFLSPQGPGGGIRPDSYGAITRPTLVVTGSKDDSPRQPGKSGAWRRQAFDGLAPGDKVLLWLDGAHHNLGGISGGSYPGAPPADAELLAAVQETTLAFWQVTLAQNVDQICVLESGPASERATVERR